MVRPAAAGDRDAILTVVEEAFSGLGRDGHDEVDIVRDTWSLDASPDGFDLVAIEAQVVIGHVLAAWGGLDGRAVLGVAPLAVAPAHQRRGIGQLLMSELLRRAAAAGVGLVALLGSPGYYGRFGFEPSGPLGIHYPPVGRDNRHFMVRRLGGYDPSLRGEFAYCWELRRDPARPG